MASVYQVEVKIPPAIVGLVRRLAVSERGNMMRTMGKDVACAFGRFFYAASKTRHKTARKFSVTPTGALEFTDTYPPRSRAGGEIISTPYGDGSVTLRISGVPFLARAWGDLHITPKQASALTIPISRYSVHKRASDLKKEGWTLFTLGNRGRFGNLPRKRNGILFGMRNGGELVPLFVLVKNATIPQDRGLMPSDAEIGSWAASSARRFLGV